VKFLVDNQLPAALARFIESRGGFRHSNIPHAESGSYILVSKDEDFLHLALRPGVTAGLVWVRIGNCRKEHLLAAFDRAWLRLVERIESGERIVEVW
jgi:predicted nuclease of predicted toxin-antitoxin system